MTLDRIVSMLDERQGRPSSHDTSDNAGHNPHMPPGSYNYLERFMSEYAPHFPFIVIPPGTTAEDLARDQPFFYLVLCMVACPDGKKQRDLVASVKRYVAEHVIFDAERSLDVVKGLLVYLAWYVTHAAE